MKKPLDFLKCTRRGFIAGTATIGVSLLNGKSMKSVAHDLLNFEEIKIPTCCHMCGGGTGVIATVRDGVVAKLEPNKYNPIGVCNTSLNFTENQKDGAAMCPKGLSGIMALYDPDRVKKPLLRTNPEKGINVDPKWREITWDEAFDIIVRELKKLINEDRPEALITFSENSLATSIQRDFGNLFGTPNISFHTNICSATRKAATMAVFGVDEPLGDYQNSKYMLIFGWNPLSAVKWSHLPQILLNGKSNGSKLVIIDPRYSETAAKADLWYPIIPGTDGALALAMSHVIIEENLYNQEFIENWTFGFDEYKKYLKDKTPEWAEKICGVSAKDIKSLAIEFATNQPSIADAWIGPGQQSNGFNSIRAVLLLNVLVGSVDEPGGMMMTEEFKLGESPIRISPPKKKRFDGKEKFPFGHNSGVYVETFRQLFEENGPYKLDVAFITMSNLVLSMPNTSQVVEGLKKLKFIVVNDNYLNETSNLADIVIPGTTYLERFGLVTRGINWEYVALRQPVIKPLFNQYSEAEFFIELAKRLELKDQSGQVAFSNIRYEDYLDIRLQRSKANITLDELKEAPGGVWTSPESTEYRRYEKTVIKTETKKFQFSLSNSSKNISLNYILPEYQQRRWLPDKKYPYYLISWKHITHTHSRTQNNPYLSELKDQNYLYINPMTANSLGFKDGELVGVISPFGETKAQLRFSPGMHPEVLGTEWGFGHWAFGDYAREKGFAVNQLNKFLVDEVTGQALHKEICVNIRKI
ncbi:hypothetical protein BKP35_08570 [Anaerobacillus arseniciselenatis]|uniref:4Fe-4S Mo/W bis-MGD-type domain-containing protein n=1 Tax=Anaerobacillus arseniciselenatis TaxID=85682 RepID=A0A1S2LNP1_9BACI|nr:molybdopterin-dependent oxidoreductase [Anaerobacillus arseniciselenatis]OIJ13820.1 hypothetical protein BKP35_08570 [Anaerobacillus arseniciselenatis]